MNEQLAFDFKYPEVPDMTEQNRVEAVIARLQTKLNEIRAELGKIFGLSNDYAKWGEVYGLYEQEKQIRIQIAELMKQTNAEYRH